MNTSSDIIVSWQCWPIYWTMHMNTHISTSTKHLLTDQVENYLVYWLSLLKPCYPQLFQQPCRKKNGRHQTIYPSHLAWLHAKRCECNNITWCNPCNLLQTAGWTKLQKDGYILMLQMTKWGLTVNLRQLTYTHTSQLSLSSISIYIVDSSGGAKGGWQGLRPP